MSRVSCLNDENPENQADQFLAFFLPKRGLNQVPRKETSSITISISSQSGLPMDLINTPISKVSCLNVENPENQADQLWAFLPKMQIYYTKPWPQIKSS